MAKKVTRKKTAKKTVKRKTAKKPAKRTSKKIKVGHIKVKVPGNKKAVRIMDLEVVEETRAFGGMGSLNR